MSLLVIVALLAFLGGVGVGIWLVLTDIANESEGAGQIIPPQAWERD